MPDTPHHAIHVYWWSKTNGNSTHGFIIMNSDGMLIDWQDNPSDNYEPKGVYFGLPTSREKFLLPKREYVRVKRRARVYKTVHNERDSD